MTFVERANEYGKALVYIVELPSPRCTRVYGSAPCTAAVGVTGAQLCFNTLSSCQDEPNYAQADVPYRFSTVRLDGLQAAGEPPVIPTIINVDSTTAILQPGKGLGVRSSVSITIQDHPWSDSGCDPYLSTRAYQPDAQGTFWGKWLARNKFWANRRLVIRTGFLNPDGSYDAANFRSRSYIVSDITGPDQNGVVTINGKDPLRFADGEKAKVPQASVAKLSVLANDVATILTVAPAEDLLTWWNASQRYIRVEDEIMLVTAQTGIGTASATLTVNRASMPARYEPSYNVAKEHRIGAGVVPCWWYDEQMIYDVLFDLLNRAAGIDASFLDYANWVTLIDDQYSYLSISALIVNPTDVKTLITELTQLGVIIWWHDRDQKVKLKGVRAEDSASAFLNEADHLVADSVQVMTDSATLITQTWMMFDLSWPLANMELLQSYRTTDVRVNLDRESDLQYGKPSIRTVRSRWLTVADVATVIQINGNLLQQYENIRRVVSFSLDPKDDGFWVGDIVSVTTRQAQDIYGAPSSVYALLTQMQEKGDTTGLLYDCVGLEVLAIGSQAKITHPADLLDPIPAPANYGSASPSDRAAWVYISDDLGLMSNGSPAYEMT